MLALQIVMFLMGYNGSLMDCDVRDGSWWFILMASEEGTLLEFGGN